MLVFLFDKAIESQYIFVTYFSPFIKSATLSRVPTPAQFLKLPVKTTHERAVAGRLLLASTHNVSTPTETKNRHHEEDEEDDKNLREQARAHVPFL